MKTGQMLVGAALCLFATYSTSTPLEGDDGRFVVTKPSTNDFVTNKDQFDGSFVTGPAKIDSRSKAKFLIGTPRRSHYVLFSQLEEKAIWDLRESEIQKQKQVARPSSLSRKRQRPLNLHWPRIIVNGDFICAPQASFANSDDWKEHLTCWNKETQNVK